LRPKRRFVALVNRVRQLRPDVADAALLITTGNVLVDGLIVTNPRSLVSAESSVAIRHSPKMRGEEKLRLAMSSLSVDVHNRVALDVGAAAGGFTKALLVGGARLIYAVDVGHGQLAGYLRQDARVVVMERTNISQLGAEAIPEQLDVITLDLSKLSLSKAAPQLNRLHISRTATLVALVKPMFELELPALPPADRLDEAVERAIEGVSCAGWAVVSVMQSPILGKRGAVEFFICAVRAEMKRPDA
jgi:23S rRNA (cytidine1920-2'-O)/16S rRNA (cytidine1409-2'-O)-methyltransferase